MKTIQEIVPKVRCSLLPAAAISVVLVGPVNAADDPVKEKAALCNSCHGEAGVSETEEIPSLAGQPDLFLSDGWREQWRRSQGFEGTRRPHVQRLAATEIGGVKTITKLEKQ